MPPKRILIKLLIRLQMMLETTQKNPPNQILVQLQVIVGLQVLTMQLVIIKLKVMQSAPIRTKVEAKRTLKKHSTLLKSQYLVLNEQLTNLTKRQIMFTNLGLQEIPLLHKRLAKSEMK
jgi:hypothetical protein